MPILKSLPVYNIGYMHDRKMKGIPYQIGNAM